MASLHRSPFFYLRLMSLALGAVACAGSEPERAATGSNDLVDEGQTATGNQRGPATNAVKDGAPVVDEDASSFQITSYGYGGFMPAGSVCIPGQETYRVSVKQNRIAGQLCLASADGTFQVQQKDVSVDNSTLDEITDALYTAMEIAPSTATESAMGHEPLYTLHVARAEGSASYFDDHYASEIPKFAPGAKLVTGIPAAFDALRALVAKAPERPVTPNDPKADVPVWKDEAKVIAADVLGSGPIRAGASCAPGEAHYAVALEVGLFRSSKCVITTEGNYRRHLVGTERQLEQAELDKLVAALKEPVSTLTPTCDAEKPMRQLFRDGEEVFVDEASACHGAFGHAANLTKVFDALEKLASP